MLLKTILFLFCYSICLFAFAQKSAFYLHEAVQYGIEQSETWANAYLDGQLSIEKVKEIRAKRYPQINGAIDFRDNIVLPTNIIPGDAFMRPGTSITAKFGTQYNATVGAEANYALLDLSIRPQIKGLELNQEIASENRRQIEIEIAIQIKKAYYTVLIQNERVMLAKESIKRAEKLYNDLKTKVETYQVLQTDADKAYVDLLNRNAEITKAQQMYEQSLLMLKYAMGYPQDEKLSILDSTLLREMNSPKMLSNDTPVENRPEYRRFFYQIRQDEFTIKRINKGYYPTVNLYGYSAIQALRNEFSLFDTNKKWYGIVYFGLRVNVPIFDGLQKEALKAQTRIQIRQKANSITAFERQFKYEQDFYAKNYAFALENVQIRKNSFDLAKKVVEITREQYKQDLRVERDVIDAETTLLEAQTNYLVALYDCVIAKLDLEKVNAVVTE